MSQYTNIKTAIANVIKANGNNEITGGILQHSLMSMINSLGTKFQFAGIADPADNPLSPDANFAWLALPGTYTNYGGLVVPAGSIGVILWNGTWTLQTIPLNYEGIIGVVSQNQVWTGGTSGYTYEMQDIVRGTIPQSFIDIAAKCGAIFNVGTGYFEMNGLTDISYQEMLAIDRYKASADIAARVAAHRFRYHDEVRTYPKIRNGSSLSWNYVAFNAEYLEIIAVDSLFQASSLTQSFYGCKRLRRIGDLDDGEFRFTGTTAPNQAFSNCYSLETVALGGIKTNISFAQSSLLSNASILYIINNEASTGPITITLHATAYARATADATITAALSNHTNISLASA